MTAQSATASRSASDLRRALGKGAGGAVAVQSFMSDPSAEPPGEYVPGACNIGPAEIARRRHSAIAATVVAIAFEFVLLAVHAPRPVRLLVGLPAAAAIASWLQVVLRFCLGFATAGLYNFGALGTPEHVQDPVGRKADLRRVRSLVAVALIGGLVVGVGAALIP